MTKETNTLPVQENQNPSLTEMLTTPDGTHPAALPQPVVPTPQNMVAQEDVNGLVGGAKLDGYKKGYEKALEELQEKAQSVSAEKVSKDSGAKEKISSSMTPEDIQTMISEEMSKAQTQHQEAQIKAQQEQQAQQILSSLASKVNEAQQRYPDYDDVTRQVDFTQLPDILELANLVDNSGDVFYDLAKNPSKIATLRGLPPQLAALEMQKLSGSIKQNGKSVNAPKQPLSQLQPSNVGTDDGNLTLQDLKKKYRG